MTTAAVRKLVAARVVTPKLLAELIMARNIVCGDSNCVVEGPFSAPLVASGQYMTLGWDIPTYWAVLEGGIALMSNGHGSRLERVDPSQLLNDAADNLVSLGRIRKALGMKPPLPQWVRLARENGWVPPAGWDESEYDVGSEL
jgi:hypothetical protein